jgi:hypothetical protein
MQNDKTSLSNSSSLEELGEFWDGHDLGDFEEKTLSASFEVALEEPLFLFSVERELREKLRVASKERGVSPETLLNLWLQERVARETA